MKYKFYTDRDGNGLYRRGASICDSGTGKRIGVNEDSLYYLGTYGFQPSENSYSNVKNLLVFKGESEDEYAFTENYKVGNP